MLEIYQVAACHDRVQCLHEFPEAEMADMAVAVGSDCEEKSGMRLSEREYNIKDMEAQQWMRSD